MSRVPEILDALYGRWNTDEQLRALKVRVTDGPYVSETQHPDWVMVGYRGSPDDAFEAATSEQDWASLGADRSERVLVTVGIVVRRGDNDVKPARDRAYAVLDRLAADLKANPSAGLGRDVQIGIARTALQQDPATGRGVEARLVVTLGVQTYA